MKHHPFVEKLLAMPIEACAVLSVSQRAALAAEIAELMEAGVHVPPIPNLKNTAKSVRRENIGSVYFLHAPRAGLVKIGFAVDVESRVHTLRTMSPLPLVLLGAIEGLEKSHESFLHRKFKSERSHGEWFFVRGPVIEFIRRRFASSDTEVVHA